MKANFTKTYTNKHTESWIGAVLSITGVKSPRYFLFIDGMYHNMRLDSLANFLNEFKDISQDIVDGLYNDFKDVLNKTDKGYKYIGPQSTFGESWSDLNINKTINFIGFSTNPPVDLKNSCGVLMNEIAITDAENPRYILGTYGPSPYIIVAGYNPVTKAGFLTHYSSQCIIESLTQYFNRIKSEGSKIQIYLYGGHDDKHDKAFAGSIVKLIEGWNDTEIMLKELCQDSFSERQLALDTKTGKVYKDFDSKKLDFGKHFDKRMEIIPIQASLGSPIPLVLTFDGITEKQQPNNIWQQYSRSQNNQERCI